MSDKPSETPSDSDPQAAQHSESIAADVAAIGRIDAVPMLLRVVCEATGMRFAVVARVSGDSWTACAVEDDIDFGLQPGDQLDIATTLCKEVRERAVPIVINQASTDPIYSSHHTPRLYGIESYISVPIVLPNGDYFGNLCAIDPRPARLTDHTVRLFQLLAELIALHFENNRRRDLEKAALLDERATSELREQFIAVLGHDLRSPLSAIAAGGQLLELKGNDPDLLSVAGIIRSSVKRMSSLIEDVLDFARGRLGSGIELNHEPIADLDMALLAVAHEIRAAHPGRAVISTLAIEGVVRCDRGRLQQLAANLLSNALTHGSSQGAIHLRAATEHNDLVIEVANEGDPIPEAHLGRLFEPFWRRSTSIKREGLGLGLHICAQIVRAHGGELRVTSTRAEGTRFVARMPIAAMKLTR